MPKKPTKKPSAKKAAATGKPKAAKKTEPAVDLTRDFTALEKIVDQLESGNADLTKALKDFEQGLKLAQGIKQHLTTVEHQIETLKEQYSADS